MAFIKLGQADDIFSEESYNDFLKSESVVPNTRQRDNGVSFIDAMLSPEADFSHIPYRTKWQTNKIPNHALCFQQH